MQINDLVKQAFEDSIENGWWNEPRPNLAEKLALIHSEVSEALEDLRAGNYSEPLDSVSFTYALSGPQKPIGFLSELADIVIRVADLCGYIGADLENAILLKLEYNRTRGERHGGKAF